MQQRLNPRFDAAVRRWAFIGIAAVAVVYLFTFLWHALQILSATILLYFAAWLICFILSPLATLLEKRGLSRVWAVAVVYLALAAMLAGSLALGIPAFGAQVGQIAGRIQILSRPDNLRHIIAQLAGLLKQFGMSDADAHHFITQQATSLQNALQSGVTSLTANAADLLSSVSTILLDTVIVLILSFYMMLDGRRVLNTLIMRLPESWRDDVHVFEQHVGRVFGGFMRSQLIIGFAYGLITGLALVVLGIPAGFFAGLLAGIIMIIPFVGPFLALVPPMALVLLEVAPRDVLRTEIVLFIILFLGQQLVMQVLAPRIMSSGAGLHPLWLFAALLIGARVAGAWGAFFAAPIAALLAVICDAAYTRLTRDNPFFHPSPTVPPTDEHPGANGHGRVPLPLS